MQESSNQYHVTTANWRATIKSNQRRSRFILIIFIGLYLLLGLLLDTYMSSHTYPQASLSQIVAALLLFQITPIFTLLTTAIAIISIWVAFIFHDRLILLGTNARQIKPEQATTLEDKQLINIVEEMQLSAGLRYLPKIFVIDADYMNAFASGYSEKSALIAVTRGLLEKLKRDELQAVIAHEISHIRHLDIKLTLLASVLSNLMLLIVDVLFYGLLFGGSRSRRSENRGGANPLLIVIILLRYLLPLLTVVLMLFLSRSREYMADAGAVELLRDNGPMARALLKIQQDHQNNKPQCQQSYKQTRHESVRREAYIFDPTRAGISTKASLSDLFSTHPSIQKRLAALGYSKDHT